MSFFWTRFKRESERKRYDEVRAGKKKAGKSQEEEEEKDGGEDLWRRWRNGRKWKGDLGTLVFSSFSLYFGIVLATALHWSFFVCLFYFFGSSLFLLFSSLLFLVRILFTYSLLRLVYWA